MQVIDLHAEEAGVHHSGEEAKRRWDIVQLAELLFRLESEGCVIHSPYGSFFFDNGNRAVIDVGKPGDPPRLVWPSQWRIQNRWAILRGVHGGDVRGLRQPVFPRDPPLPHEEDPPHIRGEGKEALPSAFPC